MMMFQQSSKVPKDANRNGQKEYYKVPISFTFMQSKCIFNSLKVKQSENYKNYAGPLPGKSTCEGTHFHTQHPCGQYHDSHQPRSLIINQMAGNQRIQETVFIISPHTEFYSHQGCIMAEKIKARLLCKIKKLK